MSSEDIEALPSGADELRAVRMQLGLTQQRMADKLGVSTRAIEEYESGRNAVPLSVRLALHIISMKVALERHDPKLTSEDTGRLAERLADLRTQENLGNKVNGWAISVRSLAGEGHGEMTYSWAVAADKSEDALAIIAAKQPEPKEGFSILARLSKYTVARLGLKEGDACPM
jgi:transcriptional regulator with XRE-family HTH domain